MLAITFSSNFLFYLTKLELLLLLFRFWQLNKLKPIQFSDVVLLQNKGNSSQDLMVLEVVFNAK